MHHWATIAYCKVTHVSSQATCKVIASTPLRQRTWYFSSQRPRAQQLLHQLLYDFMRLPFLILFFVFPLYIPLPFSFLISPLHISPPLSFSFTVSKFLPFSILPHTSLFFPPIPFPSTYISPSPSCFPVYVYLPSPSSFPPSTLLPYALLLI